MHLQLAPEKSRVQRHQDRTSRRSTVSATSSDTMMSIDQFDRLPDSLALLVFNKLADIKTLGRCCAVSKRFSILVPQVENAVVKVDCVISGEENGSNAKGKGIFGHLVRFMIGSITKPLQALQHFIGPKKAILPNVSHHSPGEVLKIFRKIKHLRIELPGGELGIEDGVLLKWKAEFGSSLESCVVLGATSVVYGGTQTGSSKISESDPRNENDEDSVALQEDEDSIPESFYNNGGLKLRVVWTISSLIAASARHYLLQQIVYDHPTLQSLILTDADGQGTLCMGKEQLNDFRNKPIATSASANRTQVPALNMKLRYAMYVDLPGGIRMEGATLVAIRPSEQALSKQVSDAFVAGDFEGPFAAAAKVLMKRRTYLLEMNSF